jgi:hypothetical protein
MTRAAVIFTLVFTWFAVAIASYSQLDAAEAGPVDGYGRVVEAAR